MTIEKFELNAIYFTRYYLGYIFSIKGTSNLASTSSNPQRAASAGISTEVSASRILGLVSGKVELAVYKFACNKILYIDILERYGDNKGNFPT